MTKILRRFGGMGYVMENDEGYRVFIKFVQRKKHFMRRNQSWAISLDLVQELNRLGVDSIELHITDEERVVTVDMDIFNCKSSIERYGNYEEQAFLNESYWAVVG